MMNKNGTSIKLKRTKKKEAKKQFACWHVVLLKTFGTLWVVHFILIYRIFMIQRLKTFWTLLLLLYSLAFIFCAFLCLPFKCLLHVYAITGLNLIFNSVSGYQLCQIHFVSGNNALLVPTGGVRVCRLLIHWHFGHFQLQKSHCLCFWLSISQLVSYYLSSVAYSNSNLASQQLLLT